MDVGTSQCSPYKLIELVMAWWLAATFLQERCCVKLKANVENKKRDLLHSTNYWFYISDIFSRIIAFRQNTFTQRHTKTHISKYTHAHTWRRRLWLKTKSAMRCRFAYKVKLCETHWICMPLCIQNNSVLLVVDFLPPYVVPICRQFIFCSSCVV